MATTASVRATQGCHSGATQRVTIHHSRMVAAEPAVPGAPGIRPLPKNVPTTHAQVPAGVRVCASRSGSKVALPFFIGVVSAVQVSVAGVAHGRRDNVLTA